MGAKVRDAKEKVAKGEGMRRRGQTVGHYVEWGGQRASLRSRV